MEGLTEYLYVDQRRVDSYFEQLSVKPRRVPSYSASLGVTGPRAGASWTSTDESRTGVKLEAIRNHLATAGMLAYHRPTEQDRWDLGRPSPDLDESTQVELSAIFRQEEVELQSAYIDPGSSSLAGGHGMTFWIDQGVTDSARADVLFLVQEFPLPDQPGSYAFSGYSMLSHRATEFGIPVVPGIGANPLGALEQSNARIGAPKMCSVLYRVRATFNEPDRDFSLTTVGYPIAIWRS